MENKVTGALTPDDTQKVLDALRSVQNQLPFLIKLNPTDSKRIVRMEAGRAEFVRRALLTAATNPQLRPQFLELTEMESDLNLCHSLDEVLVLVGKLHEQLIDTRDQAGHEAYSAALEIYNTIKRAKAKGIVGAQLAYEELSQMFAVKPREQQPVTK